MWKGYKIIDADAHLQEPFDLWKDYMEPEFYDRRPIVNDYEGGTFFHYAPCELFPEGTMRTPSQEGESDVVQTTEGTASRGVQRPPIVSARNKEKYGEAYESTWSVESRLKDMDRFGWDKMVCVPGTGAGPVRVEDKDQALIWATARAYNNWAHDFCSAEPTRLKMVAELPGQHDIEGLLTETRRCVAQLGAVSIQMPRPARGSWWHDPQYDGLWDMAQELDFPCSFHGAMSGAPHTGARYRGIGGPIVALEHAIGFPFEDMIAMGHMIYTGILERFSQMRVIFMEGNAGWLPFWLGRLDDHAAVGRRQAVFFDGPPLPLKPSEYFYRQAFVSADCDELGLKAAVDTCGADNIVWNTDYPHPDAPDPDKAAVSFLAQPISDEAKQKILWDNPIRAFGQRIMAS